MVLFEEGKVITDSRQEYHYTLKKRLGSGTVGQVWSVEVDDAENPNALVKFFVRETNMTDEDWFNWVAPEYLFAKWSTEYSTENNLPSPCKSGSICAIRMFEAHIDKWQIAGLVFANKGAIALETYYSTILHPALRRGDQEFVNRQGLKIAVGLLTRIAFVHRLGAVHMDIKPANIVVVVDSFDQVRDIFLIDFGLWCTPNGTELLRRYGIMNYSTECPKEGSYYYYNTTPTYADPESIEGSDEKVLFSKKAHIEAFKKFDLFAAAVTIWYAWAPDEFSEAWYRWTAIDPQRRSRYTPVFAGYELSAKVGALSNVSRAIFDESGALCFLLSKMSGPLDQRWSADQLITIFTELVRFNK